jgi:uncharacterized protein
MNQSVTEVLREMDASVRPADLGVRREVLGLPILQTLDVDLVLTIQGVRRCGKSTLLRQIAAQCGVLQHALFINFEDPRLGDQLDHRLLDAIVAHQNAKSTSHCYFFLDEIQNVKGWEKWLHIQLEKKTNHFVITGSHSTLYAKRVATALTGRHRTLELFPFSFREYKALRPEGSFDDYLREGGFPRVLVDRSPADLLREYFIDIMERDVRHHVAARSIVSLVQLGKALAEAVGSETSYRKLAAAFDVSVETVQRHIQAFESAYLYLVCPYFANSARKRAHRPKKYYCIDNGLRACVSTLLGQDLGKRLEQYVFLELRKRFKEVFYWRGAHEVDFIVQTEKGLQPLQVSYQGETPRSQAGAKDFYQEFPRALPVVTVNGDNAPDFMTQIDT